MTRNTLAALGFALILIAIGAVGIATGSDEEYAYYDVECSDNECIRFNPQNGESWVLACPGAAMTSCEWEPLEVRP